MFTVRFPRLLTLTPIIIACVFLFADSATAQSASSRCDKETGDNAIAACTQAIRQDPNEPVNYARRGEALEQKGEYARAIEDYNVVLRMRPKEPDTYYNRGVAWVKSGEVDKAIADYTEAIRQNPKLSVAYAARGGAWYKKNEFDRAILDYSEAIRSNPKNVSAYAGRGGVWNKKGDYDKAISDFNEAIRQNPKYANAYSNRGVAWSNKGEYEKAIADYDERIRLDPKSAGAYRNRGESWSKKGEYDRAISDYNEAIRLDPSNANARENLQFELEKKQKQEKRAAAESSSTQKAAPAQSNGKRVALIIGNGRYSNYGALENPTRDAGYIAETLKKAGFDTVSVKSNLSRQDMLQALRDFEKVAADADWAAIYYAGHGIEVGGINYLIPVDAQLKDENSISAQAVNIEYILNTVEAAKKLRLVILDACRDNPFVAQLRTASATASRSISGLGASSVGTGLARIEPAPGTLVVYSTKNGQVALDGDGKNSPFVEALVKRIEQKPPIEIRRMLDFTREDVFSSTKKQQQPFSYGSLSASEDFFFVR